MTDLSDPQAGEILDTRPTRRGSESFSLPSIAGTYRHIPHACVPAALSMGWIPICPFNDFSALMKACNCNKDAKLPLSNRSTPDDPQTT